MTPPGQTRREAGEAQGAARRSRGEGRSRPSTPAASRCSAACAPRMWLSSRQSGAPRGRRGAGDAQKRALSRCAVGRSLGPRRLVSHTNDDDSDDDTVAGPEASTWGQALLRSGCSPQGCPGFWLDEAVPGGKASSWSPGLVLPAGVARPPPEHAPQAAAPQAIYRQDAPSPGAPPTLRCPAQRPYKGAAEARNSTNRTETFPVQSELCSPSLICISNDQSKCLLPTPVLLGPNCEDLDQLGTGRARSCVSAASPVLGSFVVQVITM